jgi:undecaprenyl-diphosphatase
MSYGEALILAVVQGLTEFLPISSSGHLAIAERLLGTRPELMVPFTLLLHLPSLAAVVVYYRKRLLQIRTREAAQLVVATLPIVAVGALLGKHLEAAHAMPALICALLIVNGCFLYICDRWGRGTQLLAEAPWWKIVVIGIAQAVRLPGLSRSGSTIGTGWLVGLERPEAVRFSFYLSIPAVLGAFVWKLRKMQWSDFDVDAGPLLAAVVVTFVLSLASIRVVESFSGARRWIVFVVYSIAAGGAGLLWFGLRG